VPELKIRAGEQLAKLARLPEQTQEFPAAITAWEKTNDRVDAENLGEKNGWQKVDADMSGWQKSRINAKWRDSGLTNGGIAWIRKEVDLPATVVGKNFRFNLGLVDEQYVTAYWNGEKLGESGRNAPEFYYGYVNFNLPPKLLHQGKNIFALRFVVNTNDKSPFNRHALELGFLNLGLKELSDDCLVKVEREFTPLTKAAVAARPVTPKGDVAHTSSALFGGMIQPLVPFAIKGALWYQGEQDAGRALVYRTLLPLMINDWRTRWGWDFPFIIQQLPNWDAGDALGTQWAKLREAQAFTANSLTNCFVAVGIDIGEANDVHPKNKREIGRRLALVALANVYGRHIDFSGPVYDSMSVEGSAIRLKFKFADGLKSLDGGPLKTFVIAGADRKFVPAEAKIDGVTLMISNPQVAAPVAVRYAFINNPEGCNFSNASGLPAMPFRTDDWPF
jgi:sialate O-acetylesterase